MWIFTEHGFFTFVTDRKDPEYLWLRARMREHLEDNFPGVKAEEHPGADYLYRAKVKRTDVAERIAQMVLDSRIDSHFKDVMISRAAKPKTGSLSNVMYAVWRGAAEWQPYAPYSKVPRTQMPKWQPTGGGAAKTGGSKGSALPAYSNYTGRAADYDWSRNPFYRQGTPVGETARDPKAPVPDVDTEYLDSLTDDEFADEWARMTPEEQQAFLDAEEASLRSIEIGEDEGTQAALDRWFPSPGTVTDWGQVEADRRAKDRERQTKVRGRKGKRGGRKNRHNQKGGQQ